jgi:hypothetical protein
MSLNARIINAVLHELPADDRLAALICSVIERKPQAMSALVSMVAVIGVMSRHLSDTNRIALAEIFRGCADHIERRRVPVHID